MKKHVKNLLTIAIISLFIIIIFVFVGFVHWVPYLILSYIYITLIYIVGAIFLNNMINKGSKRTIFYWLDSLSGGTEYLNELLGETYKKDILTNLEIVQKRLLVATNHDLNKLRLLKAYFKTINTENGYDLFIKTIIALISSLIIAAFNTGKIFKIISPPDNILIINITFLKFSNVILIVSIIAFWFIGLIYDLYINKRRNKIIEEIIDICLIKN